MIALTKPEKKVTETTIVRRCVVALNRLPGVRVTRNNTGFTPVPCQSCKPRLCRSCSQRMAYPVPFGLGEGGPDIVGFMTLRGDLPVWFGIEVKKPGARTAPKRIATQRAWRTAAGKRGALVAEVCEVHDAVVAVESFRAEYNRRLAVATW